ncbi:MAG: hypothetical protein KAR38_16045, partial [Calditrichia bacterium]|nr:hypothetical protein [Calditrichia bacterium]
AWHAQDAGFDVEEGALNRFGIEYSTGEVEAGNESWTGTIYIDNVNLFGIETGAEWVFADFENEAGGTQGFVNVTWNAGITNFTWAADPTGVSEGVLQSDWDFSIDLKDYIENNNVNLGWADTAGVDTGATAITVDVYLPEGFPMDHTMQISVVVRDHDTYDWIEDVYVVNPDTFTAGDWTTVSFDLLSHIEAEDINPFMGANVGVQIYDMSEASTWTGTIYWDNFTLIGVEEPVGDLVSPTVIASVEGTTYEYVHLGWTDNNLGTEKYRVFMSDSPITDIAAEGVYRIGAEIPHGTEYKNFRPFTTAAESKDYYFAVVAVSAVGEETALNAECVAGPITITTSPTAKVYYDANFAASFVLDGLDTEFTETYTQYALQPESASGDESAGWTIESTDMMFNATFVIDDDYLYISGNVTDDDLNSEEGEAIVGGEAWMGDALEFYLGFYDHNFLTEWHEHGSVMSEGTGDVRISFCAWGEVQTASATYDFPGLESTVYESFFGDGYIIEARIALDSLALDGDMEVLNGTILPLRIDGTDLDPTNGDEGRTLLVGWGSSGGNAESWLRPSCWGYLEVINGPT